eukprot:CAMPEP_0195282144 /NCGR_PEP_ID=MMETSP0707-20130614/1152_1 /TAXON_ID=33640 /ORGANISM="Asterionellopsis glacialis, Strain CCMP134" /LENGTH=814 /DNA_ID=CAMNT_0040341097 /DNA_START=397 /DNA_END=2841 /DNA_ORIENTATION=-
MATTIGIGITRQTRAGSLSTTNTIETSGSNASSMNTTVNNAVVDAYAIRILNEKSGFDACVDESLGPYVAGLLRCSLERLDQYIHPADYDVTTIPDFESLVELLEEHCNLDADSAHSALHSIAMAVAGRTDMEELTGTRVRPVGKPRGSSIGSLDFGSPWSTGLTGLEGDLGSMESLSLGNNWNDAGAGAGISTTKVHNTMTMTTTVLSPTQEYTVTPSKDNYSLQQQQRDPSSLPGFTPLKEDNLIPLDLLGVLDDPSTPNLQRNLMNPRGDLSHGPIVGGGTLDDTPIARNSSQQRTAVSANGSPEVATTTMERGKKSSEVAKDLAAALFRPSRGVRHNGVGTNGTAISSSGSGSSSSSSGKTKPLPIHPETKTTTSSSLHPAPVGVGGTNNSGSGLGNSMSSFYPSSYGSANSGGVGHHKSLFEQQLESAIEILLSMNSDLSEESAHEAALVANTDVNVAQYIIDGAMSAPPVCRHMLNDGCYRSDCQFSHDVEGHTCIFWLRGRCGKGDSCRFLHGFADKLLEGIDKDFSEHDGSPTHRAAIVTPTIARGEGGFTPEPAQDESLSYSLPKPTSGFMVENECDDLAYSLPTKDEGPLSFMTAARIKGSNRSSDSNQQQKWDIKSLMTPSPQSQASSNDQGSGISFAKIASRGYSNDSFASPTAAGDGGNGLSSSLSSSLEAKTVRIPQDLWNPHINRDASVFRIADPFERYDEVNAMVSRSDVIDLHFQSTKTFSIVLSAKLPEKLRSVHSEGVWIVTGTGHHVGTKTHQQRNSTLEQAVLSWLLTEGYDFVRGRDSNGHGGAILVRNRKI